MVTAFDVFNVQRLPRPLICVDSKSELEKLTIPDPRKVTKRKRDIPERRWGQDDDAGGKYISDMKSHPHNQRWDTHSALWATYF